MSHDGATYEDSLAEPQRLGLAEADPSADVEGFDAEFGDEFLLKRVATFGAEAADAFVGVVAGKCGEVHA